MGRRGGELSLRQHWISANLVHYDSESLNGKRGWWVVWDCNEVQTMWSTSCIIMTKASGHRHLRLSTENVAETLDLNFLVHKEWWLNNISLCSWRKYLRTALDLRVTNNMQKLRTKFTIFFSPCTHKYNIKPEKNHWPHDKQHGKRKILLLA